MTPEADGPQASPPPILVVDDERGYREGIRRILAGHGLSAATAEGGAQAIELATRQSFAVALVDLKMPDVDGFEVIETLRRLSPGTLCIVVSAFATIESAVQTTKMGAFDFVVKPFAPDDLLRVVDRALDQWHLAREADRLRTEQERSLLALAAEQSRLRTIVQSMGDGLLVVNADGVVVLDNPAARRLLDKVAPGCTGGALEQVLPDVSVAAEAARMLAGCQEAFPVRLEVSLGDPGAGGKCLRTTIAPIRDGGGRPGAPPPGIVVLLADMTEAKAFERMKTMFVSMVAHELKAPIGAVEGYLHLFESGMVDRQPDQLHAMSARCLERTGALLALVQDLLEITRRDAGRHERRLEAVDVGGLARGLAEFHEHDAAARGIKVGLYVDPASRTVLMDKGDLDRVVTNLLSNAIKYNRAGGSVKVSVYPHQDSTVVEVADTGIGMSDTEVRRLGEEFFRAKNPETRLITGTGLGIALVKKIIDSYHGALQVQSAPGKGSVFRVVLPSAPDRAPGAKEP